MDISELIIRSAGTLLLLNIFTLGAYLFLKGYFKFKRLSRMIPALGAVESMGRFFRVTIKWRWMGEEVFAVEPNLFALTKKEVIPIFLTDNGMNFYLNIWTHNGKGPMVAGILLCLLATGLAMILI